MTDCNEHKDGAPEREDDLSCKDLVDLVTEYLEGGLTAEQHAEFELHLGHCEGCEVYLDQMRETRDALGHLPCEAISCDAKRTLMDAFRTWKHERGASGGADVAEAEAEADGDPADRQGG